jgi:hypothetical protein
VQHLIAFGLYLVSDLIMLIFYGNFYITGGDNAKKDYEFMVSCIAANFLSLISQIVLSWIIQKLSNKIDMRREMSTHKSTEQNGDTLGKSTSQFSYSRKTTEPPEEAQKNTKRSSRTFMTIKSKEGSLKSHTQSVYVESYSEEDEFQARLWNQFIRFKH